MVKYRRFFSNNPDEVYFLTLVTDKRIPIFKTSEDYLNLHTSWNYSSKQSSSHLEAYVFLPDHLHVLLRQGKRDFSDQVKAFKRRMNYIYSPGKGTIWQHRFWEHRIKDEADFENHADYIHFNPVKHGYVKNPSDWIHSSFKEYLNEGNYSGDWSSSSELINLSKTGE